MLQNQIIAGALPITAKLLAQDLHLQLHFGASGFKAGVDEEGRKHLFIPNLPMDDKIADALALGGIVHENGHFDFTDFSANEDGPDLQDWVSVLEDIRIELAESKKYPGAKAILARMVAAMVQVGQFSIGAQDTGLEAMKWYVLYRLRSVVLGQEVLAPLADQAAAIIEPLLPGAAFQRLTNMMFQVAFCKSTVDCQALAERLLAMLKEEAEEQQPDAGSGQNQEQQPQPVTNQAQPSQGDGDGGNQSSQSDESQSSDAQDNSQGQSGQGDQKGGTQSDDQSDNNQGGDAQGDSQGQGGQKDDGPSAGNDNAQSGDQTDTNQGDQAGQGNGSDQSGADQGASQGQSNTSPTEPSGSNAANGTDQGAGGGRSQSTGAADNQTEMGKRQALREYLASAGDGSMDTGKMIASALGQRAQGGSVPMYMPDAIPMEQSAGEGVDVLARLRAETNAVRRKTINLLEAEARNTRYYGRSGGRLDPRRMWRIKTGNTRVFEKQIEGHKQDTAILMLIDRSTSMKKDDRIHLATDAALAVALAMDNVPGIATSVAAFPCENADGTEKKDVLLISDWRDSFRRTAARFPAVGVCGCTPLAEALLWAGYQLHATRQERKILVVTTDGQPDHRDNTLAVLQSLRNSGIEVLGLGIGLDVQTLFPVSARIDDLQGLSGALFKMLQSTLAKAA